MHAKALTQQQLLIGLLGLLFYAIPFSFANESILQMFEKDFQKIVTGARPRCCQGGSDAGQFHIAPAESEAVSTHPPRYRFWHPN